MMGMGEGACPFEFNFDEKTFKPGDTVSYRVTGDPMFEGMPFAAQLLEVHEDHVITMMRRCAIAARVKRVRWCRSAR